MPEDVTIYITGAILLGIGGFISWQFRNFISEIKSNFQILFKEIAEIKAERAVLIRDVSYSIAKINELESRITTHAQKLNDLMEKTIALTIELSHLKQK